MVTMRNFDVTSQNFLTVRINYYYLIIDVVGRDSAVGIATRYGFGRSGD